MSSTIFGDDCNNLNRFMLILDVGLFGVGARLVGLAWCINFIIGHPGSSSPLPSGESPPESSLARAPDLFIYGVHKYKTPSKPDPQARHYTAPGPYPAPSRYERSPFGPPNLRPGQLGMDSRWTPSASGTSSARSSRGPLTPSPRSEFLQPKVFVEPRRRPNYSWFNAPHPASPISPPASKPGTSYDTFAALATALLGPFITYQQLHSEPSTPACHHSVGPGERIPFSSPPLTFTDLAPPHYPASPLWAPRSPKEVDDLGPNAPGQRSLPPAPTSSYLHRPMVSIAEAIRLRMNFDDMRISPVPAEDQDYDMRGPGMGDMDVDQMDSNDMRISPVPAEDEDYDMRGPGMGDMDVDRVLIVQDVEMRMSPAVAFEEDVVMGY
ncbi:hypothetical protein FRC10_010471 [Ceratobasidium sp. 414]|nr:hypothetical protein FRC10_010471 [Ceratobasidium sp. 414]